LYAEAVSRILVTWVGKTDLRAPHEAQLVGVGPIAQALETRSFDEAILLTDHAADEVDSYQRWLTSRTPTVLHLQPETLSGPTHFGEIYEAAVRACDLARERHPGGIQLTFHLSPGTPAMAAVWIILGKTRFPAELIESSAKHGVKTASVPFDISADFIPDLLRTADERLRARSAAAPPPAPEFADIIHRSKEVSRLIERSRRVAVRNVPVLIEGESGTGKELFARAIHRASPRRDAPFLAINCGAVPRELAESEFFGYEKGAFTGANATKKGYFEAVDGGTIFLDEIGELRADSQVRLLRVLQEGEVLRVGARRPVRVDVRVIAATHRTMIDEVAEGRFREDLFHRLAVAVLKIPPLRERGADLGLLVDHLLAQVNRESTSEPGYQQKRLSAAARNLLLAHPWPGNIRELLNTLRRAAIWSDGTTIGLEDVRDALLPTKIATPARDVLGRPLGNGFELPSLLHEVARHYLSRAMEDAQGNKRRAAELVGLPSYQTLTNWLSRHGMTR